MTHFLIKNSDDFLSLETYHCIDCTYFLPNEQKIAFDTSPKINTDDIVFDVDAVADTDSVFSHMFPPKKVLFEYCIKYGINYGKHYIFYDHKGVFSAPRVYLTFLAYGFDKISVLDGGYPAFLNFESFEKPIMDTMDTNNVTIDLKNPILLFVDNAFVMQALNKNTYKIIDARPSGRFNGTVAEPRAGLLSGHIPHSVNLPFMDLLTPHKTFKPIFEMREMFHKLGVTEKDKIIFTCGSGITACVVAFSALMCGFSLENIKIYDASWCEWGNGNFDVAKAVL
jgi:thiosulfate/3-mercaptopyruvate sulfurtransferase